MRRRIAGYVRTRNHHTAMPRGLSAHRGLWALGLAVVLTVAGTAAADPASPSPPPEAATPASPALISPVGLRSLDRLLVVPSVRDEPTAAERTDAFLADAIARRGGDRRVATTGFRKRNIDLFRAERPVEVGQQEMLLRLRLRAKSRETMSVELRY